MDLVYEIVIVIAGMLAGWFASSVVRTYRQTGLLTDLLISFGAGTFGGTLLIAILNALEDIGGL